MRGDRERERERERERDKGIEKEKRRWEGVKEPKKLLISDIHILR